MVRGKRGGFTLLEMMTVLAILGVLACVAIPAYMGYMRRSKASEVTSNLNAMFKATINYYSMELSAQGTSGMASGNCIVDDGDPSPVNPSATKQPFVPDDEFKAIGFTIPDLVYFSYGMYSARGTLTGDCRAPASTVVYTLFANGDLDDDNTLSTYEMVVGTNSASQLYHSPGFYTELPDE